MSRIKQTLAALHCPALITFIMAGDPGHDQCLSIMKALPPAGADIIELGMPFTDPAADGPVIQAAGLRALRAGADMGKTLKLVQDFRIDNNATPIVLMGYANPVLAYGFEKFIVDAATAGVDGLIIVDLPAEEDAELRFLAQKNSIDIIRLMTPTTDRARLETILPGVSGFLYYVSITGVTGAAKPDPHILKPRLHEIREVTNLPVALGFGIRTPEDAAQMGAIADAVVVGSALIQAIAEHTDDGDLPSRIAAQVAALAHALKDITKVKS